MKDLKLHAFAVLLWLMPNIGTPLGAPPAAQHPELHGIVTDPSGAGIPNATITLETATGKQVASVSTDASDHYALQIAGKLDATYRERVIAPGFRTLVQDNITLPDGANRTSDLHLTVGATAETVTVTAVAAIGNGGIATVAQAGTLGTLSLEHVAGDRECMFAELSWLMTSTSK